MTSLLRKKCSDLRQGIVRKQFLNEEVFKLKNTIRLTAIVLKAESITKSEIYWKYFYNI